MHNPTLFPILLSASTFLSYSTLAACTANPGCSALGYTKTSCASEDLIIKCPFDTAKVQCIPQTCETIGKKTCGDMCIKSSDCCTNTDCASGKVCDNYVCKEAVCAVGDIYYSDKTCSANLVSGKTPIGVVGYVSNGGKNGVVVALDTAYDNKSSSGIQWGCYGTDLTLTNYTSQSSALNDFSGKSNTDVIASQCGTNTAAYYCKNTYSKGGVSGWYLPAYGELYAILDTNFSTVNTGLSKISSNNQISSGYWYWSSSEYSSLYAWRHYSGYANNYAHGKDDNYYVRCVLAF